MLVDIEYERPGSAVVWDVSIMSGRRDGSKWDHMKPQCLNRNPVSSHRGPFRVLLHCPARRSSVVDRTRGWQDGFRPRQQQNAHGRVTVRAVVRGSFPPASWTQWILILTPRVVISHPVVTRTLCYIICNNDPYTWHLSDWYNMLCEEWDIYRLTVIFIWLDNAEFDLWIRQVGALQMACPDILIMLCRVCTIMVLIWAPSLLASGEARIEKVRLYLACDTWYHLSQWHRAEIIISPSSLNTTGTTSITSTIWVYGTDHKQEGEIWRPHSKRTNEKYVAILRPFQLSFPGPMCRVLRMLLELYVTRN